MNSLWDTPSCSLFAKRVANEIWQGKIVLVFLPAHAPQGFLTKLKIELSKGEDILYAKFDLSECDSTETKPVESLLHNHYLLDKNNETYIYKKASSIFSSVNCELCQILVFEKLSEFLLPKFKEFLIELGRYLAGIPEVNRHKILVVIDPNKCRFDDFPAESGIIKFKFEGIVDKLDLALSIRYFFGSNKQNQNPLFESIIISLSKFDLNLSEKLWESNNILENYNQKLQQFAESNKWQDIKFKNQDQLTETEKWQLWALGILDRIDGTTIYHSAFLKIHNKQNELDKCLWLSGLQILLPLIEEFRMKIISSKNLQFPRWHKNGKTGEVTENKEDFEIGDICFMLNISKIKTYNMSAFEKLKLKAFISLCRDIRNDISHLRMSEANKNLQFFADKESVELILEDR